MPHMFDWQEYLEDNEQMDVDMFTELVWPNIKQIYRTPAPAGTEEQAVCIYTNTIAYSHSKQQIVNPLPAGHDYCRFNLFY